MIDLPDANPPSGIRQRLLGGSLPDKIRLSTQNIGFFGYENCLRSWIIVTDRF